MKVIAAVLLSILPMIAWAQGFDTAVDFGIELSSLDDPEVVAKVVEDGRIVILEGLLGDAVIENGADGTRVLVTLVGGSWIGTDEVRSYSCMIIFDGARWVDVFPGVKPKEPSEDYVPQGSRLLVAAKVIGIDDKTGIPTAEMVDFRILK